MYFKASLFFCLTLLCLKGSEAFTRTEITSQYRPTLNQIRAITDQKIKESGEQYNILHSQIENWIVRTRNVTQTQINSIKSLVADAKKQAVNISSILTCIRGPESQANSLTTTVLNPCTYTNNYTALINSRNQFQTLGSVATNSISWCSSLNPLPTQDGSYAECLAYKIPDLNLQINLVQNEYFALSNDTLNWKQDCLAKGATAIYSAIGNINYRLNMCKMGL